MESFLVYRIEESAYGVSRSYTALHRLIFVRNAFSLIEKITMAVVGRLDSLMAGAHFTRAGSWPLNFLKATYHRVFSRHHGHKVSSHLFSLVPPPLLISYRYLILLSRQGKVVCSPDFVLAL